ncbi:MAG: hypothetical protein FP814_12800 [Desulfobacterium sp.]|nr:hypothetical protein [Desulfobacterium sp.]MBU3948184.1 hypothetical protein [Pseudomonadota bacterium]MBU4011128.1 hypothetical protein [Pseudomonadota bacterium]MBU4035069.1 hypothetical protein [Pseudomonadota bacterium]
MRLPTGITAITETIIHTASRDLEDLVLKGVLRKIEVTGRNAHYVLTRKQDMNNTQMETGHKLDKQDITLPVSKGAKGAMTQLVIGPSPKDKKLSKQDSMVTRKNN